MKNIVAKIQAILAKAKVAFANALPYLKKIISALPALRTKIASIITAVKNFTPAEMLVVKIVGGVLALVLGVFLVVKFVEWPVKEIKKIEAEHKAKKENFNLKVQGETDTGSESQALDSVTKKLGEKK